MKHGKNCNCKPGVNTYLVLREILEEQSGKSRYTTKLSIRPRRDPVTKKLFWLRRVVIHEVSYVATAALGWGMGLIPYTDWKTVEVSLA